MHESSEQCVWIHPALTDPGCSNSLSTATQQWINPPSPMHEPTHYCMVSPSTHARILTVDPWTNLYSIPTHKSLHYTHTRILKVHTRTNPYRIPMHESLQNSHARIHLTLWGSSQHCCKHRGILTLAMPDEMVTCEDPPARCQTSLAFSDCRAAHLRSGVGGVAGKHRTRRDLTHHPPDHRGSLFDGTVKGSQAERFWNSRRCSNARYRCRLWL